ncbi:hypothetical protein Q3A66_05035 [Hymenobacter sp. BT770]|uniref:hypothetical protein n=1 Tax=Hymenobacter sp. BT770 TaxID=2886942 RepID=UPI001D115EC6|nr:hypothetical protein [Hymenobacter sp. BT770]MCC3154131.1 hypothetical protein [Hymenobacter sp. BT770]MDO3414422.1 hypothetical protein [Hymenobacter sp. BT770]
MRHLFPLFIVLSCLLAFLPGCEPKEDLVQTSGSLEFRSEFRTDTVLFDTVFTTIKTVTKRLWVYNRNGGAVKTDINLAGIAGTAFSVVINGDARPSAQGVTIRGKDSLLVLVRAVVGDNGQATSPKQFLVTDELRFRTNGTDQNVKLVAYGQNAYFHRADIIRTNTTWATDKPHVIINSPYVSQGKTYTVGVVVAQGVTLRIPKGARIYSHAGAYLQVDGTLLVNDLTEPAAFVPTDTVKATNANIVRFQADRLEPYYAEAPGQWGGIVFTETSKNNRIRYAEIKNATFGALLISPESITLPHPSLTIENSVIRNISGAKLSFANTTAASGGGIISYSGSVTANNCLFTNCGEFAVLGVGGGVYNLNFCTIANYSPAFLRETASLTFSNESPYNPQVKLPLTLNLQNSIVWGSFEDELQVINYADYATTLSIRNSLLRTKLYATTPSVVGTAGVNLLNVDPAFKRTSFVDPDYTLQDKSPATTPRRTPVAPVLAKDLRNLPRPSQPSLGAYEHK